MMWSEDVSVCPVFAFCSYITSEVTWVTALYKSMCLLLLTYRHHSGRPLYPWMNKHLAWHNYSQTRTGTRSSVLTTFYFTFSFVTFSAHPCKSFTVLRRVRNCQCYYYYYYYITFLCGTLSELFVGFSAIIHALQYLSLQQSKRSC